MVISAFTFGEWLLAVYVLGHDTVQYYPPVESAQQMFDKRLTPIIPGHIIVQMRMSSIPLYKELADVAGALTFGFR